jgi:hypothetical protein
MTTIEKTHMEDTVELNEDETVTVNEVLLEEEENDEVPEQPEIPSILRTSMDGCFEVYKGAWGSYLRPTADPDANVVITDEHYEKFEVREDIHKIPADLWQHWIQLCFHFVDKVTSSVEVSIRILRNETDPSQYRFLVPEQSVSAATVRANDFDKAIDIVTGEVIQSYPPAGWIPIGSSHSHNTMGAFFSGTDDKYELGDPGIHIVVGTINTVTRKYTLAASVVGNGRRFELEYHHLIDATPVEGVKFHPDVLNYVKIGSPVTTYTTGYTYNKKYQNTYSKKQLPPSSKTSEYSSEYYDPYWYSENANDVNGWYEYWQSKNTAPNPPVELWNVEDIILDYQVQHGDDLAAMYEFMNLLKGYLSDLEGQFEGFV